MRTRACLGWLGVLILGAWAVAPAGAADKPATPPAGAAAPASSRPANPDDDLDDLDEEAPAQVPARAPAVSATPAAPTPVGGSMPLEPRPDRYSIQRGDTLWAISSRFWGDPAFWPKLWSYNPYIGNAHLIFPGNVLRFDAGSYVRAPSMELGGAQTGGAMGQEGGLEATEVQESVQPQTVEVGKDTICQPEIPFLERKGTIAVQTLGFLREGEFGPLGKISQAKDNKLMLSDGDQIFIKFSRMSDVQCGQKYTIYQPTSLRVKHPVAGRRVLGSLYRILGEVKIVDVSDFVATGRISVAYGEIHRGDLITDIIPTEHQVEIKPSTSELDGYIVERLNQENSTLSTNDVIFIDRGEEDGVRSGDSFYVVRQGDPLDGRRRPGRKELALPDQVIGKVVVISPGDYVSEAVITEAVEVIEVGDRITTQVD